MDSSFDPLKVDCHQQSRDANMNIIVTVPQSSTTPQPFASPIYLAIYLLVPVQFLLQVGFNELHIPNQGCP